MTLNIKAMIDLGRVESDAGKLAAAVADALPGSLNMLLSNKRPCTSVTSIRDREGNHVGDLILTKSPQNMWK
jgi:hypothetical protein